MNRRSRTTRAEQRALLALSPFELKDKLIGLAKTGTRRTTAQFLNAGRGNPNWICTTPREAFATLLQFALEESKRVWDAPDLGGMLERVGIAKRFNASIYQNNNAAGAGLLH